MRPIAPGEIIQEQLDMLNTTAEQLANHLDIPTDEFNNIIAGINPITPDIAIKLSNFFNTSQEFWLNLQALYEVSLIEQNS